jgi:hypothetical protein
MDEMEFYEMKLGSVPWTDSQMRDSIDEFAEVYSRRPMKENVGGMASPHLFLIWFLLRQLKPKSIIESGVWFGLGTWFIEQACPNANIYCIDPVLERIRYRSSRAEYSTLDFARTNWSQLDREETVLFFDDHQNAYQRLIVARWMGFRHLVFEDNYAEGTGDCYSIKKVLNDCGHQMPPRPLFSLHGLRTRVGKLLLHGRHSVANGDVVANDADSTYVRKNVEIYHELPPVFSCDNTRFGIPWHHARFQTPAPLLKLSSKPIHQDFLAAAASYTWMCYVRLL